MEQTPEERIEELEQKVSDLEGELSDMEDERDTAQQETKDETKRADDAVAALKRIAGIAEDYV